MTGSPIQIDNIAAGRTKCGFEEGLRLAERGLVQ